MWILSVWLFAGASMSGAPAGWASFAEPVATPEPSQAGSQDDGFADDMREPGPRPLDVFHPDNQPGDDGERPDAPAPAYGGRIILHLESMPENLNRAIENSTVTRNMHLAIHDTLVRRDFETWEWSPRLCESWHLEDMVVLTAEGAAEYGERVMRVRLRAPDKFDADGSPVLREESVLYGRVQDGEGGELQLEPVSRDNPLGTGVSIPAKFVSRVERGTVFTFNLREGVLWHPGGGIEGHRFDARDVVFSWSIHQNPDVDSDSVRYAFLKATHGEVVDDLTARFFYEHQYFGALEPIGNELMLLPSHLYDLSDPDNPEHDPEASAKKQADFINDHPLNSKIVGLGPYRITVHNQEYIEAERFDGYYDASRPGYFDTIRWRYIADDNTAFQALLNGELDFFSRVKSADYFGPTTKKENFTSQFYAGYFYYPSFGFTAWNMRRPQLADRAVRQAIAHAFDLEEYKLSLYKGLAVQVTGPFPYLSPAYDHSVEPLAFDPDKAVELLEDAGWYDRNGNGIADKDGVELEIGYLIPAGNHASKNTGLKLQESLERVGIKLNIEQAEWATFGDRLQDRDFDGASLAWVASMEDDPEQLWHSKWGGSDTRGSNYSGIQSAELDRLIESGQRELDFEARQAIWHGVHRMVYREQPFLFMYNAPRKFAMSRRVRGVQTFALRPGYDPVRWYFPEGTPGTRATLGKE